MEEENADKWWAERGLVRISLEKREFDVYCHCIMCTPRTITI